MNSQPCSPEPPPARFSEQEWGWLDRIAQRLIRRAARRAPPAFSERLGEEWLADFSARAGPLSRLQFALGCCWATAVIAHELGIPVRAAAAATGNRTAGVYLDSRSSFFSRRSIVILLIVALHVLVIYGLATGLVRSALQASVTRLDVLFLEKPTPRIPPPPPLVPKLTPIQAKIPPPPWPLPPEPPGAIRETVPQAPPHETPGPLAAKPVTRILGGPGAGFPSTDDFYPEASRRLGEKGVATVNVCVDSAGRLMEKPAIGRSSGSARLDEGALKLARAGSGHYRPTTEDSRAIPACYPFRIRFELTN